MWMRVSEVAEGEDVADGLINHFLPPDAKKDDDARGSRGRSATRRSIKAALVALMASACLFSIYVAAARDGRRGGASWAAPQHVRVRVQVGDTSGGATPDNLFAGAPSLDYTHPAIKRFAFLTRAPTDYVPPPRGAHWVSVIEADAPGGLLATWVAGSSNETGDAGVYVSRYSTQAMQWSEPQRVNVGTGKKLAGKRAKPPAVWYPVLCRLPAPVSSSQAQQILLFFKSGSGPLDWRGMQMSSHDGGASWDAPTPMRHNQAGAVSSAVRITGPYHNCHISHRQTGPVILAPAGYANTAAAGALVEYSQDRGETWRWTKAISHKGNGQMYHAAMFTDRRGGVRILSQQRPTATPHDQRNVQALLAVSEDSVGLHWGEAREVGLPNPDSPLDVATLTDGRVMAVYNHAHRPGIRCRALLSVALSYDDGETWRPVLTLAADTQARVWEFSHPSVTQTGDGMVHVLYYQIYTGKKTQGTTVNDSGGIRHVVLDPKELDADHFSSHPLPPLSSGVANMTEGGDGHELDGRHREQHVSQVPVGQRSQSGSVGGRGSTEEEAEEVGWVEHPDAAQQERENPQHAAAVLYDHDFGEYDNSGAKLDTEGQPISSKIDG